MAETIVKGLALLVKGGDVINSDGRLHADFAVRDGKIVAFGNLNMEDFEGYKIIDASNRIIFPGGIDPHVHFSLPTSAGNSTDDFITGSKAALAGGTTAIIDFVTPKRGQSLLEALYFRRKEAELSLCDYKLHMGISEWNNRVKQELIKCFREEGIRSCKAYLAYGDTLGVSYDDLVEVMKVVSEHDCVLMVHCEDEKMIRARIMSLCGNNQLHPAYHALSRPKEAEIEAIRKVIHSAEYTGCCTYIVHVSTGRGAELIREAKARGSKILAETCMQYLTLNEDVYDLGKPARQVLPYVISPPIRSKEDQNLLWKELLSGTFDTIGSDHCPFNIKDQKDRGINDFRLIPNGAGGVENRIKLLYTYGVHLRTLSLEHFVSLTSRRAGEIFGWGSCKGKIAVGYDAEFVIWDSNQKDVIKTDKQFQRCDSNIYDGFEIVGKAVLVGY
jgi:dihydropyrimidinase